MINLEFLLMVKPNDLVLEPSNDLMIFFRVEKHALKQELSSLDYCIHHRLLKKIT